MLLVLNGGFFKSGIYQHNLIVADLSKAFDLKEQYCHFELSVQPGGKFNTPKITTREQQ